MFGRLYDLIVFLTNNYSQMPEDFKREFPEEECVRMRLSVSSLFITSETIKDYEK